MRDDEAAARHARFGALPERIAYEDLVEEKAASPEPPEYGPGGPEVRTHLACLAWDLAL
ncbi:hypothetical protein [Streptomyces huiliensis]|uniref:hypothetical protein n=1 Tax=Streptomyces huiliensis TaxID=2876027 RepID=UPI001CC19FE2|nr:hypothetical protein [Streptomyces huiliensis]MBZ4320798.1 hypothetical protein [Streptomyces huiliensis]